jgi:molecular chaperone GrpE (heat shock protein)
MRELDDVMGDTNEIMEVELDNVDVISNGTKIDISDDYSFAREKIITSIVRSSEVLDQAVIEVKMAANPRNIEAAAAIAKNLNDATENLLRLHKEFRIIEKPNEQEDDKTERKGIETSLTEILTRLEYKPK